MDDDALDGIAEELYGVPPEEFVAARTAARDRVKDGDKELAKAVIALPKPTTAAWVCNLLVRRRPEEVSQLREVGEMLRQAQQALSGPELRKLGQQRNQVVAALARQARGLAHAEGHDVSTAVAEQVESTLRAAVVDPDAGEALAAGRLTTALTYSGLGPVDLSGALATPVRSGPAPRRQAEEAPTEDGADRRRREAEERRQRELDQARRDAEEATGVARDAAAAAEAAEQELADAQQRREDLRRRADQLAGELRRAEREAAEAVSRAQQTERRRDAAVRRSETAAAIRDRSAARVAELEAGGR
ncbi:hypothetical protein [Modestobacter excelsi]|uniref:hypothetical protein n=1 Tax=Modestobacter excelsi TaxID=2213161 RepID=UPI001FEAD624|nr:hypothetical protein [Modestobacter excelsi]